MTDYKFASGQLQEAKAPEKKHTVRSILEMIVTAIILTYMVVSFVFCKTYIVKTGSMEPTLPIGSLVTIETNVMPEIGDIATFSDEAVTFKNYGFITKPEYEGAVTTHRVIDIDEDGNYIFKGDAPDAQGKQVVSPDRIVGKELWHITFIAPVMRLIRGF